MKIPFLRNHKSRIQLLELILGESSLGNIEARNICEQISTEYILKNDSRSDAINARDYLVKAGYSEQEANKTVIERAKRRLKFPVIAEMYDVIGEYESAAKAELNSVLTIMPGINISLFYGDPEVILEDASNLFEKAGNFKEAAKAWHKAYPNSPGEAMLYERAGLYKKAARIWDRCGDSEKALRLLQS